MKIKNIIIIWLVAFTLASCVPAPTTILPTKTPSSSATSTYAAPSATLPPSEIPATPSKTPIPTEVPITAPPGFEYLTEHPHYGPQFDEGLEFPRNHFTGWTTCFRDQQGFRKVNFMIGTMQIRSVFDCYFQNNKRELQKVTLAYSMWDTVNQAYYMYGSLIQRKADLDFNDNYMNTMEEHGFGDNKNRLAQFKINYWGTDPNAEKVVFLKPTADLLPPPTDDFYVNGNANFGDQPGAPNFVFSSTMNWQP